MKTFSIFIICVTLAIFYSLAVDQQNKLDKKNQKPEASELHLENMQEAYMTPYMHIEEDFSMEVTGKDHIYLNTGLSYIEHYHYNEKKQVMITQTEKHETDLSGS